MVILGNGVAGAWALAAHRWPGLRTRALWWFIGFAQVAMFVQVIVAVGITREGGWVLGGGAQRLLERGAAVPGLPATVEARGPELEPLRTLERNSEADLPVVVLPLLHGPFGEDGTVQGLCEMAGVP